MAAELAGMTPGLVGADIQHVCSVAALIAVRRGASAVTMHDLSNAVDRLASVHRYKHIYNCAFT
jgi:ATP-dependent Zn protease